MAFDTTTLADDLKNRFTPDFIESMVYPRKPLFAALKKMKEMTGDKWLQPVVFDDLQATSADLATAQTQSIAAGPGLDRFEVTRIKKYSVARVDNETILATKGDQGAFFQALTKAIDQSMSAQARRLNWEMYKEGWGDVGQVQNSSFATTTLTLTNASDVVRFSKGQILVASTSQNAAVLKAGTLTVAGVNRAAGTVTMTGNLSAGIATIAQNDWLFLQGDRQDSATPTRVCLAGIEAWCPATAPSATAFFAVDRTQDSRLGGLRYDGTGQPIEEALIDAASLAGREGAQLDFGVLNPVTYGQLIKSLGSKVQYVRMEQGSNEAKVGFEGIRLYTPAGQVDFFQDQDCPSNRAWMLQLNTWLFGSMGDVPRIINTDGLEVLRGSNYDGVELRVGYYGNAICKAPGWNINVQI